ncbi:TBC1 domain family member 19 [Aethina tumida]|uniref:TBC1 domain family member 19 n=1 Tax=Aethina tumida TaxID=116153 RepID=UPI0021497E8A|nr:TBC1 domain family member 19 [Aethina tumida]
MEDFKNSLAYKELYEEIQVYLVIYEVINNVRIVNCWEINKVTVLTPTLFIKTYFIFCQKSNCSLQKLVVSRNVRADNFKESLLKAMEENGLQASLKNSVYRWTKMKKKETTHFDAFFRKSQINWDRRIHKSLNSMCNELGITLAKLRAQSDREEIANKWSELSNFEVDIHKYRPVYAPKDFLEVLLNLKGPFLKTNCEKQEWEFVHIPLRVRNIADLKMLYNEFARGEKILGIHLNPQTYSILEGERITLGEKVLQKNYAPVAQEYLKKGCPRCMRAKMWSLILGSEVKEHHLEYYKQLKENVLQYDLMIDKLIIKDITLTASNDDQYFVFEDDLYQIMLCFSRDAEILKMIPGQPAFMQVVLKGTKSTTDNNIVFPPSGVIPFHGFTMYAAPFCYLYEKPAELYFTFRTFYLRYWHRLHRICSNPQGIVSLCLQYERMLQCYEPTLWYHFKRCRIHPLRVVIKWMMRAFSGHLPLEQLLNLWDLILAYDSLEVIPMLAGSIVIFRKENLMRVDTVQGVEAVLADLSSISVIPLLQMALMKEE